jgi:O-antigen/teichoic acid export membrane protein
MSRGAPPPIAEPPRTSSQPTGRSRSRQDLTFAGASVVGQALIVAAYIITARGMPVADFGLLMSALAAGTFLSSLCDMGSTAHGLREIAAGRLTIADYLIALAHRAGVTMSVLGVVAAALCFADTRHAGIYVSGALAAGMMSCAQASLIPLRATLRVRAWGVVILAEKVLTLLIAALLLLTSRPEWALAAGISIGAATSLGLSLYLVRAQRIKVHSLGRAQVWPGFSGFGGAQLAVSAQGLDLPLFSLVGSPAAAAAYAAVTRWTNALGLPASVYSQVSYPHFASATSHWRALQGARHSAWMLCTTVVACLAAALSADTVVPLLLGDQYASSASVLRWLALTTIIAGLNQPLFGLLQARGADVRTAQWMATAVAAQLSIVLVLGLASVDNALVIGFAAAQILLAALLMTTLATLIHQENRNT